MNVILLLIDSLNRHHLEPYGCKHVKTPNLQAFADRGVTMTRHFAGSLPCMPARREIYAGVREFPWRGWGHIEAFDSVLPAMASRRGYVSKLITDHYHFFQHGSFGYYESFSGYDFIRGQELDQWKTETPPELPSWVTRINTFRPHWGTIYYRNTRQFKSEKDWFTPKVFGSAQEWLVKNHTKPFFLFIDHFEVHEPFHCIEPYRSLYTDDPGEGYNIWPPYQDEAQCARFFEETSEQELAFLRAQYWGKVTWVDTYFGRLMETLDDLNLWDDTTVIITTDHGHDLAEWRPMFGKQAPHHDSHAHLPLLISHPAVAGGSRVDALTSTLDLHSTVREILGIEQPDHANSRSFLPVLLGERGQHRAATVCGTFGSGAMIADQDYTYVHQPAGEGDLFWYSGYLPEGRPSWWSTAQSGVFLPGVACPVWRMPASDLAPSRREDHRLYRHAEGDPSSQPNIIDEEKETAARMRALLTHTLLDDGCPEEQFERLALDPASS